MATELAKAYVQLVPSAQGIKGGIEQVLGNQVNSAGSALGSKLGKVMAAGAAAGMVGAGLGKIIQASLSEGAKLQQSKGGIQTLFKDQAATMEKYAQRAYKTVGISANDYMEQVTSFSASLLQGLGGNTKKAAKISDMAMKDMGDNANKFGTDMGSIQQAYQGFAKQNYTMLDNLKLGYGGTKTEMERLLKDAGKLTGKKYDIKNLSDVYEAIHAVQGELGITGTTADEAGITFEGSFNAMKAAATNLIGNLALGENVEQSLGALIETIGTFVGGNLLPMVGTILTSIGNLIINNIGKVPDMITQLSEKLLEGGPGVFAAGLTMIKNLGLALIKSVPFILGAVAQLILYAGLALLKGAGKFLAAGAKWVWSLTSGVRGKIAGAVSAVGQIPSKALEKVRGFISSFKALGEDIVRGMIEGVKSFAGSLGSAITSLVKDAFTSGKKAAKVGSPSKLFRDGIGKWIPLGVAEGVSKYAYALDDAVDKMVLGSMASPQQSLPTSRGNITAGVSDSVVSGLSTVAAGMGGNGGTIQVNTYLYPNSAEAGKAIYRLNEIWKGRLNNG